MRGAISLSDPNSGAEFALMRALEERLGPAEQPRYQLVPSIAVVSSQIGILPNQTITGYQLTGTASYRLAEIGTGITQASGSVRNFTSYSATSTGLATTAAERDAQIRLATLLADQIVSELILVWPDLSP